MRAENISFKAVFLAGSGGDGLRLKVDTKDFETAGPRTRENAGMLEMKEAMTGGGRKPQKPEKGVKATAISGCGKQWKLISWLFWVSASGGDVLCGWDLKRHQSKHVRCLSGSFKKRPHLCRYPVFRHATSLPIPYQDEPGYSKPS